VDEDERLVSHPGYFTAGELASNSDWTRSCVGPTFCLVTAVLAIKCVKVLQIFIPKDTFVTKFYTTNIPYILEFNPRPFYTFKGLKNQMRIRIACG
jgi:hypothetical protein